MDIPNDILRYDEKIIFELRALYSQYGYAPYKVSRFEEYGLYAANKAFLPGGDIIAFTGAGGKLLALRPDVTLSIVKNTKNDNKPCKLYYNENIYRTIDGELRERMQVGLEHIGRIDAAQTGEVIMLAKQSLDILSCGKQTRLYISHMGFLNSLLSSDKNAVKHKPDIMRTISEKNIPQLKNICETGHIDEDFCEKLVTLASVSSAYEDAEAALRHISINDETAAALRELARLDSFLKDSGVTNGIFIDFSVVNDITYYNGIVFQGFIDGIPSLILSGGRYDELIRNFGRSEDAIGFAVYPDLADPDTDNCAAADKTIGVALPKGRLGDKAYELFEKAGFGCPAADEASRKLVLENPVPGIRYFWVKPSDVATYVERGAADIGITGKDSLLENHYDVYQLLDLGLGKCRMCIAAKTGASFDSQNRTLRVATKFPNIARRYYAGKGIDIDVIKLNGSIELAPLLGLSDVIVDLVETGETLAANDLQPIDTIAHISAQLISNKSGYKFNYDKISRICDEIAKYI